MVRVIHKQCGKVAFYFNRKLKFAEYIDSSNLILLDGSSPEPGDDMICGSCGEHIGGSDIIQESWTDWFIVKEFHTFERKENASVQNETEDSC